MTFRWIDESMKAKDDMSQPHRPKKSRTWHTLAACLFVGLACIAAPQTVRAESPVWGNFEFEMGPYYPDIDSSASGDPFADIFGENNRLLGEATGEYYVFDEHGKLGLGLSIGFTRLSGTNSISGSTITIEETTRFSIIPIRALVSYRWDYLVEEFEIPLAAKVQAGYNYWIWRSLDAGGSVSTANGITGRGAKMGWHIAARLEFQLNILTPQMAASFDNTWGVNNTYLYGEFEYAQIDDFGEPGFEFGGPSWRLGMAFEF
jgi:hypothetical protein